MVWYVVFVQFPLVSPFIVTVFAPGACLLASRSVLLVVAWLVGCLVG